MLDRAHSAFATTRIAPLAAGAATGLAYYAASEIGLRWFVAGPSKIAEAWPASGVLLAGLLLVRRGWWAYAGLAVFAASFASEMGHRSSIPISALLAAANVGEGLIAATLLVWLANPRELISTTRGALLLGCASALGPLASATVGATTLALGPGGDFDSIWVHWWVADGIGMLVVSSFILGWAWPGGEPLRRLLARAEGYAFLLVLAGALLIVFVVHRSYTGTIARGYLLVPVLLWAAFRLGPTLVATVGLTVTALVVWRSTTTATFFEGSGVGTATGVLGIQVVLGALMLSSLVVAGLVRQRKEAEARASEGEAERAQLAAIVNASDDAIVGCNLAGVVYAWNPGAEQMFGRPAAEAIGKSIDDLIIFPDDRTEAQELIDRVAAGEVVTVETRRRRRDGTAVEVAVTASPVRDSTGSVTAIARTSRDIGWRKQAEARALAARKLESLGLLAGNVAHDFNNLLVGIVGTTSLTLDQLPPDDPLREPLLEIQQTADRAAALTRQLLAVSGKGRFLATPVDLAAITDEAADRIRAGVPATVRLELEHAAGTPAVEGDPDQLLQVVTNLALNAAEALPDGRGTVTIRTATVDVSAELLATYFLADGLLPGRYVSLEVADDGAGMDEETVARIFDPFFTTKGEGQGLGLTAILGIVRGHGGAIAIESAPASGTRFTLLFPASDQPAEAAEPDTAPGDRADGGLVLVADDDAQVRGLAVRMLEHLGHATIEACDGVEAVEVFTRRQGEIRLVLLDLMMPGLHGTDVLARIHEQSPAMPVLLSSGYSTEDLAEKLASERVAGFLQKPYLLDTLRDAVDAALAGNGGD